MTDQIANLTQSQLIKNSTTKEIVALPEQTNFEKFKAMTSTTRHLPKIKNSKNLVVINPISSETINKIKTVQQSPTQKKTILAPITFVQYHNRNLDILKRISRRFNLIHNSPNKREESSMERLHKIKKYFNIDCSTQGKEKENDTSMKNKNKGGLYPKIEERTFYYKIGKGNNAELIAKCFKHRTNWKDYTLSPSSMCQSDIDLIWTPTSGSITFPSLMYEKEKSHCQMANHFEFHQSISNKLKMFSNIMKYCENHSIDIFSFIPLTIEIQYENSNFLKQFSSFSYLFQHIGDFVEKHSKVRYKDYFYIEPINDKIGAKTPLYIHKNHYTDKNLWLVKAVNLNRGRCIKIADSIDSTEQIIRHFYQGVKKAFQDDTEDEDNKNNQTMRNVVLPKISIVNTKVNSNRKNNARNVKIDYSSYNIKGSNKEKYQSSLVIIQKYIERPLLYYGRKFDMRIWVLLTHRMKVYFFKEGHLKATSVQYDISSKNSFVHLTNYSVQKYNSNFSKFEYGNEISFDDFDNALFNQFKQSKNVRKEIIPKVSKIIKISMKSVKNIINMNERKFCYEIFGYDFMFDCDLNPFLIEINTNPGLEISSPLISELVPRMIDDSLRLTIDDIFTTKYEWEDTKPYQSPFPVKGYSDEENLWELICDLNKENSKKR